MSILIKLEPKLRSWTTRRFEAEKHPGLWPRVLSVIQMYKVKRFSISFSLHKYANEEFYTLAMRFYLLIPSMQCFVYHQMIIPSWAGKAVMAFVIIVGITVPLVWLD